MRGTGAGRHWIRPLRGTGSPSDRALQRLVGWYAVGFRLWIAVVAVVVARASWRRPRPCPGRGSRSRW